MMREPSRLDDDASPLTPARDARTSSIESRADGLVGQLLGGKLLVERRIGHGAAGVVYRARHLVFQRLVAVKVLHDALARDEAIRARFLADARAASGLDHANLVRVLDVGEEQRGASAPRALWLAMDLLDGVDLDAVLADAGRLDPARAVGVVLQIAAGLAHAHAQGVVHGDVKPSNVVLVTRPDDEGDATECVKLCDFGFASVASGGAILGTPAYMSPEQCLGEAPEARSDVYACGVLLYELLTGEPPFGADEPEAVLRQHVLLAPEPPSRRCAGIPPAVEAVIMKALAKERRDRHGSMRELRAALRAAAATLGDPERSGAHPVGAQARREASVLGFLAAVDEVSHRERRALAALLEGGDPEAIASRVARVLARFEQSHGKDRSATIALALLDDPARLAPLAERLLGSEVLESPYLERTLARAGAAAARALWDARASGASTRARRARFVGWLTALGPSARDVLAAALAAVAPAGGAQPSPELAEDALLAIAARSEPMLAAAAAPLLASPDPRIRALAAATLGRSGARAG